MILIPYVDSNKFISYLIIQLLKAKTVKSYAELIKNISNNVICFEKNITIIETRAFNSNHKIKKVIIPDTVYDIRMNAFSFCVNLVEVIFNNNLKSIGNYAFYSCESLKEIIIPNSIVFIKYAAFAECFSLKKVIFPDAYVYIGKRTFDNCRLLKEVILPRYNCVLHHDSFEYHTKIIMK